MTINEQRAVAREGEERDKYDAADREKMAKSGEAMPDGSFPIADQEDLEDAIKAVGRASGDHDAVRKHIIARAAALGHSDLIPDTWGSDGSLKQSNSAVRPRRKQRHRAMPLLPEVRHWAATGLEIRAADQAGDTVEIIGAPIVYNAAYVVRDLFGEFQETMLPGVAADVLANGADVRFLLNHDGLPLARTASGTLTLEDTPAALRCVARLDVRQQLANDLIVAIERGDLTQMSCGFVVAEDEWNDSMDQRSVRRFADFLDVSPVTYPASPTTSVQVAQRMALDIPVESRARVRRLAVDLRAGKVLSAPNQQRVTSAAQLLHDVLDDAGVPAGQHPASTDPGVSSNDDGTIGGTINMEDGAMGYQDGTGARTIPATAAERRAASLSFDDQRCLVYQALAGEDPDKGADLWICDLGEDWVVFQDFDREGDGMFRCGYSIDDDNVVTLTGDPQPVTRVTSYEPVPSPAADDSQDSEDGAQQRDATPAATLTSLRVRIEARNHRRIAA